MAVPKKHTSHKKKNSRKASWIRKSNKQAQNAFILAKSILSKKDISFVYDNSKKD